MEQHLLLIQSIAEKYQLNDIQQQINYLENFVKQKIINIAVLGQFKSGKSSFINSFIQKNILPTNVLPATSVITIIRYGQNETAQIVFLDNHIENIDIQKLEEYITESQNPKNIKNVKVAIVELPELIEYKQIEIIDTPGIGSFFKNNTETTQSWLPEATVAMVCISAERPLAEQDIELFNELQQSAFKTYCLLTKTDFFSDEEISKIKQFLSDSLHQLYQQKYSIFPYSIYRNTEQYRQKILDELVKPIIQKHEDIANQIYRHKLNVLRTKTIDFFEVAYQASLRSDEERQQLKLKILDEHTNAKFVQRELQLISTDQKSSIRHKILAILERHEIRLVEQIEQDFDKQFPNWRGNLYHLTEQFKQWLKNVLTTHLQQLQQTEQASFEKIVQEINQHYSLYTQHFKNRLSDNVFNTLGIKLTSESWAPEYSPLKKPDISVYRVFDSHIELLWFMFPMFIFKPLFRKHFKKQIATEVNKNIHRLTSDISEIIKKQIDQSKEQTLRYLLTELDTIEKALSENQSQSHEYVEIIERLKAL